MASGEAVITFEEFWNEYPRKTAKAVALKSWLKLSEPDRVLAKNALHSHRQRWVDPQFIPHASTWLNQRRFEDVLTVKYTAPDLMPKEKAPELTPEQERIEDQRQGKIALSRMAEMSTGDQLDKLSIATNVKRNEGEDDKSYRLRMIEKIKS